MEGLALTAILLLFAAETRSLCRIYRDEQLFLDSAMAVKNPHYRILYSYGHRMLNEMKLDEAEKVASSIKAPRMATPYTIKQIDIFRRTVSATVAIYRGNVRRGLPMLDRIIFSEECAFLQDFSKNFAKEILSVAAKLHLQQGNEKHAAHIFGMLSDLYGNYDPTEREFYLGIRAMILKDYTSAVRHFEVTAKVRPDANIKANLNEARRRADATYR